MTHRIMQSTESNNIIKGTNISSLFELKRSIFIVRTMSANYSFWGIVENDVSKNKANLSRI